MREELIDELIEFLLDMTRTNTLEEIADFLVEHTDITMDSAERILDAISELDDEPKGDPIEFLMQPITEMTFTYDEIRAVVTNDELNLLRENKKNFNRSKIRYKKIRNERIEK